MKLSGIGRKSLLAATLFMLVTVGPALRAESSDTTITEARPMPAGEPLGARPYEMVRAGRRPPHVPLVNFDWLEGWQVECSEGAVADLFSSRRQRVWESPVARLVYRGTSAKSTIVLRPPVPITIPEPVSATMCR